MKKTRKKTQQRRNSLTVMVVGVAVALFFVACQQKGRTGFTGNEGPTETIGTDPGGGMPSGIDPSGGGGGGSGGGSAGPGSGSGGGVTEADKQALSEALKQNQTVAPKESDSGLSAALAAEAKRLLEEERQGRDVAVKKMLLAGKMLQECANKIAKYAPLPGQPLLGTWNGGGQCAVAFEVAGSGAGGKYAVAGGTQGTLQADQEGRGAIKGEPFSGNVVDSPQSGFGTLTHPTFFKSKSGTSPCNVGVQLATPKSPIPAHYQEAMKQAGQCFRQTLILMSPVFDRMFKNMDPAMAQMLQQRFLGIN